MVEAGKTHPTQEDEAQRMAKQPKVGQRGAKKRSDPQVAPQAWLPAPMLDGVPLPASASIKDFQGGIADVVEQAFLLLEDMAELRSIRRHEVFLNLKRYLAVVCSPLDPFLSSSLSFIYYYYYYYPCFFPQQAVQASFWVEEITNYCHQQMKEEVGRCNAAMEAFNVAKRSIQELKK